MTLAEARENIGARVFYLPEHTPDADPDYGVITSANSTFVFVRFGTGQASKATRPEDLELI